MTQVEEKAKQIDPTTAADVKFLHDVPVSDLDEKDHFGHRDYSEALASAVLAAAPPFTFGVFASWGVGKTTICKEHLESSLKKRRPNQLAYAYFDAWKYEGDSLRRQFLKDVAAQFKTSKTLKGAYKPEDELVDLHSDVSKPVETGLEISGPRVVRLGIWLLLMSAAFYALLSLLDVAATDKVVIAAITALAAVGATQLKETVVVKQATVTTKSLDSPELFEKKFEELLNAVTVDTVVIVIDNLDRCSPERVLEILGTIKTFLEPSRGRPLPIFVVPCDDKAVRRHLVKKSEMSDMDAEEFLRKFFSAAFRISPLLDEDLRNYVIAELQELGLDESIREDEQRELVQVISVAFRANPRRVKQFLNNLSAKLILVRTREDSGAIKPKISAEVAFLAKLTVIEEEFPEFFVAIQNDVRALATVSENAVGIDVVTTPQLERHVDNDRLSGFLRGTRRTTSANLRAFTRLRLSEKELTLPEYWPLRSALVDGQLDTVETILRAADKSSVDDYSGAALDVLKEELSNEYFEAAVNVVDALVRVPDFAADGVANEVVEQIYTSEELKRQLPALSPAAMMRFLASVDTAEASRLVDVFIESLWDTDGPLDMTPESVPAWQAQVGEGLASIYSSLSDAQIQKVRELTERHLTQSTDFIDAISSSAETSKAFIGPEAFQVQLNRLGLTEFSLDERGQLEVSDVRNAITQTRNTASPDAMDRLLVRLTELLQAAEMDPSQTGRDGILRYLAEARDELVTVTAGSATAFLDRVEPPFGGIPSHVRWQIPAALAGMYNALSPDGQARATSLTERAAREDPVRDFSAFVRAELDRAASPKPPLLTEAIVRLKDRFASEQDPGARQSIAALFFTSRDALGDAELEDLLARKIDSGDISALDEILNHNRAELVRPPSDLVRSITNKLATAVLTLPASQRATAIEAISGLRDFVPDEAILRIRDDLARDLTGGDPSARSAALDVLRAAELSDLFGAQARRYLAEQMVQWLSPQGAAIDRSFAPYLERLEALSNSIPEGLTEQLVIALQGTFAREDGPADAAANLLTALDLGDQFSPVVEELGRYVRDQVNQPERFAVLRAGWKISQRDRRRKASREFKAIVDELRNGNPEEVAVANELLGADK